MRYRREHRAFATLMTLILLAQAAAVAAFSSGEAWVARAHEAGRKLNEPGSVSKLAPPTDWSKEVVESTMKRYGTAESLKGWGYAKSLYLYGQYLVYLRTKDRRYLDHIKAWIDLHVDEKGAINRPINALDYMLPGNLLLILYKETKQEKYRLAAESIRKTFDTYPRTREGGFWHADTKSREWQLWADPELENERALTGKWHARRGEDVWPIFWEKRMRHLGYLLIISIVICDVTLAQSRGRAQTSWPRPVPARIQDGSNRELMVMTLGDVNTVLADAVFDPAKDEVRLKDGTIRQNYYRETLGVKYFKPIDKSRFPLPPTGWCSWYYYYQEINEDEVKRIARWIAENLKDYGARVVQIDDGWQGTGHGLGENRDWTTIDKRFPGGMDGLARYIKSLGLTPGLWLAPHGQSNEAVVKNHPGVFMVNSEGASLSSTWEGKFLVDPSTPETQRYLKELFTTLAGWGYDYFKIDGQPTVIREYRNKKPSMKNSKPDAEELYRETLNSIRAAIGPNRYLLGCWVIPLEGAGIMNGSRIGADILPNWDGFKFALRATMEYYFLHNVVWYADPDVMVVRAPLPLEQARAWATLQGLTGQALLTSDRLMDLTEERAELLRRVSPAVDVRPLDLFKNERNKRVWDLKINHLGRNYDVVGLFNFDEGKRSPLYVGWKDLGLPEDKPIHVFDFWNKEYLGAWEGGLTLDLAPASCRVLTLLPAADHPQLISTSRHITQGWVDLVAHRYNGANNSYAGRSRVIRNDPYELRFVFPRGKNFVVKRAAARTAQGNLPVKISNHDGWATVELESARTSEVSWQVFFEPSTSYRFPVREPQSLWAERAGLDGVNLRWNVQHQPAVGYQVSLNGRVLGYTPTQVFSLRGLDADATSTAEVRTAWQDGGVSEKRAQLKFTLKEMLPTEISLSELAPLRMTSGWRQPEIDRTFTGKGLSVGGRSFTSGIGMPTNSEIEFELTGTYDSFTALVGIDDEFNNEGGVEFAVLGDGKELWRSGALKKTDGAKPVKVGIKNVRRLLLRVKREGEGGRIHADWLDAKLTR